MSEKTKAHSKKSINEDLIATSDEEHSLDQHDHHCQHNQSADDSDFLLQCDHLLEQLTLDFRSHRNELRKLKKQYRVNIRNAKKGAKRKKTGNTGFTKPERVPDSIAELISIDKGSEMPRTQVAKEIYRVLNERGLRYEQNKRVLRADKQIKKIFNLPESVNQSTDEKDPHGFNFYNIQTYIAQCYNNQNQPKLSTKPTKATA